MIPRETIGTARVAGDDAGDGAELRLVKRGGDFIIMIDRNELMSSRMSGSEEVLAELACEPLATAKAPRVLIGGLGMGFTLRRAMAILPADAEIVVAELVPEIVEWAKGPLAAIFDGCLDDPRVTIDLRDVGRVIQRGGWDAIMLDVDNGPEGIVHAGNDRLYAPAGLAATRTALTPRGQLAVWSAHPSAMFVRHLNAAGFAVTEHATRARRTKGPRHVIWLATRRG